MIPGDADPVEAAISDRAVALGLLALVALALAIRGLLAPEVFGELGTYFDRANSQYHLRRAYYTYRQFPAVLMSDPYINYPGGAAIPWPPLYDLLLGSAAHLLATDDRGFERVVAWVNPLLGAITCLPVFFAGRRVSGPRSGLGAAAIYAILPVGVLYSHVGDADHHALVALLGAVLLALALAAVDPREAPAAARRSLSLPFGLGIARAAMMLTWHGSLLYAALLESTLLLAAALQWRRSLYLLEGTSLIVSLVILLPVVVASPPALGGTYSSIALSWLHLSALGCALFCAAAMSEIVRRSEGRRERGSAARLALLGVAGAAPVLALLAFPSVRDGLAPALGFLTMTDAMGAQTAEQKPLLPIATMGREVAFPPHLTFGLLTWALPALPLWLAWHHRTLAPTRGAGLSLAAWSAFFVALAVPQYRYANDLGPSIAVVIALAIARACTWLRDVSGAPHLFGPAFRVGLAVALLAPPITGLYLPWLQKLDSFREAGPTPILVRFQDPFADPINRSLSLFLQEVRRVTPETSGYLDHSSTPEYGIVADADIGHAIQYIARRPTPTDPFWSYIGERNWANAHALLASPDEATALEIAELLRARYVITTGRGEIGSIAQRLHAWDGSAAGQWKALGHFRLVTEGPARGHGLPGTGKSGVAAPYKLFEIVEGSRVAVEAKPGEEVRGRVVIETPTGRRFPYLTSTIASSDGVAQLQIPYSPSRTETTSEGQNSQRTKVARPVSSPFVKSRGARQEPPIR